MAKKLIPLGDRVIVKQQESEEKTKSGIVLPDTVKEKPQQGTVVAVGSGRVLENGQKAPMDVKIGDMIIYSKFGGDSVKIDDIDYVILTEKEILAIVK